MPGFAASSTVVQVGSGTWQGGLDEDRKSRILTELGVDPAVFACDKSMSQKMLRTYSAKPGDFDAEWREVDATDQILGRLATKIAMVLMGKHKPIYTPHVDTGDFVVVTNCAKVRVSGRKAETMIYPRYSYHPGGYKEIPYKQVMERHPERILQEAVRRMLPKNALGRRMLKKLKVYASATHPHTAQQPVPLAV